MTREEAIKYAESKKIMLEALIFREDCVYGNYAMYSTELSFVNAALSTLRPVSRERVERMRGEWRSIHGLSEYYCSRCGEEFEIHAYDKDKYQFCPYCMAPMTDEAVEMVMERWKEAVGGETR